jgi:arylsulfatase A
MADDVGSECLGCYGGTSYETPHLDALAGGGMRFESFFSTPMCVPSRISLMTGTYGFRNYERSKELSEALDPGREPTFGNVLSGLGYETCVAGKWQMCEFDQPGYADHATRCGFDEHCLWAWRSNGELLSRYFDPVIWQNGARNDQLAGRYGPDVYCDYLIDFILRNRNRPFFAYYPMALAHGPFSPTPDSSLLKRMLYQMPVQVYRRVRPTFFVDQVAYLDKLVGRIVAALDANGLRENTLLVFLTDNGTPGQVVSFKGDDRVPGGKGTATDRGTNVPLIASWPGMIEPGSSCNDLTDLSDVLPTLVQVAGRSLPAGSPVDGRSFAPQLAGEPGSPREWAYIGSTRWEGLKAPRALRSRRWKLLDNGELFDMENDPDEQAPILPGGEGAEAAAARERLRSLLDSLAVRDA